MQILKLSALIDMPWKNGGGTTRASAKGMVHDHTAWTLSRADVAQNGPFSDFAGMTRVLTVVSGGPMTLHTPTTPMAANLWVPVRFDGALKIRSHLENGPLTDLNLMFDPHHCNGSVVTHQGPQNQPITPPQNGILALHILAGKPTVNGTQLDVGDTVFLETSDTHLNLAQDDALLKIRLTYSDQSDAIKLCIADR